MADLNNALLNCCAKVFEQSMTIAANLNTCCHYAIELQKVASLHRAKRYVLFQKNQQFEEMDSSRRRTRTAKPFDNLIETLAAYDLVS